MQIKQRVHCDSTLMLAELGPGKEHQAEIDGGRIQRVQALIQIDVHRVADIERPRNGDQYLSKITRDTSAKFAVR